MKQNFFDMVIFSEYWKKKPIQIRLILNILLFQNGVKIGFGKNIEKKLDILQMGLISIILLITNVI